MSGVISGSFKNQPNAKIQYLFGDVSTGARDAVFDEIPPQIEFDIFLSLADSWRPLFEGPRRGRQHRPILYRECPRMEVLILRVVS